MIHIQALQQCVCVCVCVLWVHCKIEPVFSRKGKVSTMWVCFAANSTKRPQWKLLLTVNCHVIQQHWRGTATNVPCHIIHTPGRRGMYACMVMCRACSWCQWKWCCCRTRLHCVMCFQKEKRGCIICMKKFAIISMFCVQRKSLTN